MANLDEQLGEVLAQRRAEHLYRTRPELEGAQTVDVCIQGKPCISFSSNDYLGLANHPAVIASFQKAAETFGVGSGASHLVCGHSSHHHALEEELAEFTGRQRALLFSTGYMANLGVIDALMSKGDTLLQDRLNHASLLDAGRLCGAQFKRFRPEQSQQLEKQLAEASGKTMIATDGVFSMDGNVADMPALVSLARSHNATLMVDDAHGFGVLGKKGGGVAEHFKLDQNDLPILMGTMGKAFGTFGAFVAGSENLIEYLIQFSRTYIYTTALPPAVAAASRTSLKLLQQESWRREKLKALITRFRQGVAQLGLDNPASNTPIQPIILADDQLTQKVGSLLRDKGFLVGAIRPPTVPKGTARLRITLCAEHTEEQIDRLMDALAECIKLAGDKA